MGWDHVKSEKESYYLSKEQRQQDGVRSTPQGSYKFPAFSSPLHSSQNLTSPLSPPRLQALQLDCPASALLCTAIGSTLQSLSCPVGTEQQQQQQWRALHRRPGSCRRGSGSPPPTRSWWCSTSAGRFWLARCRPPSSLSSTTSPG